MEILVGRDKGKQGIVSQVESSVHSIALIFLLKMRQQKYFSIGEFTSGSPRPMAV